MLQYDPGKWGISFAFQVTGSVFPKSIVFGLPSACIALTLHEVSVSPVAILDGFVFGKIATNLLAGFYTILGFLIVFRSQQAYSRWWEGATILHKCRGEWFNSFSCLLAFSNHAEDKLEEVHAFQHKTLRLFSLLYACALHQVSTSSSQIFEVVELDGFEPVCLEFLQNSPDRCEIVLQWIQRMVVEADDNLLLKTAPPIVSRVFNELGRGMVNLNNARKITDFPVPFPVVQMITIMLLLHLGITPIICAASLETSVQAFITTFVVITSYWSINYIAMELEDPFGDDLNDLPLKEMQKSMNDSLRTLMWKTAQTVPAFKLKKRHNQLLVHDCNFEASGLVRQSGACMDHDGAGQVIPNTSIQQMQSGRWTVFGGIGIAGFLRGSSVESSVLDQSVECPAAAGATDCNSGLEEQATMTVRDGTHSDCQATDALKVDRQQTDNRCSLFTSISGLDDPERDRRTNFDACPPPGRISSGAGSSEHGFDPDGIPHASQTSGGSEDLPEQFVLQGPPEKGPNLLLSAAGGSCSDTKPFRQEAYSESDLEFFDLPPMQPPAGIQKPKLHTVRGSH